MKYPKVTVVVVTHDRPVMLRRALQSVLGQSFTDYELFVMEDGTEVGLDVCKEFDAEFERLGIPFHYRRLEHSGYYTIPRNAAISEARGSYIAHLDDDNEWLPEHLSELVSEIEKGGADIVYSRWTALGPSGSFDFEFVPMSKAAAAGVLQGPQFNFIDTSSMLHSKGALVYAFGHDVFNSRVMRFGDWELIARSIQAGLRIRGLDKITFKYYWHGENVQLTRPVAPSSVGQSSKEAPWEK